MHSSVAKVNNTHLAWLGDSVLRHLVTEQLVLAAPLADVGARAHFRDWHLSREKCAENAQQLGLQRYIIVGESYKAAR